MIIRNKRFPLTFIRTSVKTFAGFTHSKPTKMYKTDFGLLSLVSKPFFLDLNYLGVKPLRVSNYPSETLLIVNLNGRKRASGKTRVLHSGSQIHLPKLVEPAELVSVVANLAGIIRDKIIRNQKRGVRKL